MLLQDCREDDKSNDQWSIHNRNSAAEALKKLEEALFSPSQPLKRLGLQLD
jgi:hypothetical protein